MPGHIRKVKGKRPTPARKSLHSHASAGMDEVVRNLDENWIPLAVRITELLEEELARLAGGIRLKESRSDGFREDQKFKYGRSIGIDYDEGDDSPVKKAVETIIKGEMDLMDLMDVESDDNFIDKVARGLYDEGEVKLWKELKKLKDLRNRPG